MPRAKTTADLLTEVRLAAYLPDAGNFTDAEILTIANRELRGVVAEVLSTSDESHSLATYDVTLTSGVASYLLPPRASAGTIRDVAYVTTSGVEVPVHPIASQDAWENAQAGFGTAPRYYLRGDDIIFAPTPGSTESGRTIRIRYRLAMPTMVTVAYGAPIVSIAGSPAVITCETGQVPTFMNAVGLVDIVRGSNTYQPIYTDLRTASATTSAITMHSSASIDTTRVSQQPATYAFGERQDYVCKAGETVFPPVPYEPLWEVLVEATAAALFRTLGDAQSFQLAQGALSDKLSRARRLLQPRTHQSEALRGGQSMVGRKRRAWWGST